MHHLLLGFAVVAKRIINNRDNSSREKNNTAATYHEPLKLETCERCFIPDSFLKMVNVFSEIDNKFEKSNIVDQLWLSVQVPMSTEKRTATQTFYWVCFYLWTKLSQSLRKTKRLT